MYTLLCVFCMFSLVYKGPTADELRSVGLIYIYIYENAYFMKFVCIHVYFLSVPSVNKIFIIIILYILLLFEFIKGIILFLQQLTVAVIR